MEVFGQYSVNREGRGKKPPSSHLSILIFG